LLKAEIMKREGKERKGEKEGGRDRETKRLRG
jgi:hypothetical protein